MSKDIGITVKKNESFSEWYTQVVLKAGLVDYASLKGFIILRPYGYSIWESIKDTTDRMLKETGHQNAFLPLLIPESLLGKELEHFEGFKPEVFWVTHSGNDKLSERLALRPTSETLAYDVFSKWVRSYRDLPLKLNFWNTALRAEIKATKPLIRTSEFLWQEGHTVHTTEEEAKEEVMVILKIYREIVENYLAIPVIVGYKSDKEKFVGALYTTTLEALMTDGKALQVGTSHNLGQNFSKSFNIKYLGTDDKEHYAWQTSWGISWRLIGGLVMVHGDDKGLVLPPRVAPIQLVIVPILYGDKDKSAILTRATQIKDLLSDFRVYLDDRKEFTPGYKFNDWEMKGVPLRLEIGPKDLEKKSIMFVRRDTAEKTNVDNTEVKNKVETILQEIQNNLYIRAQERLEKNIYSVSDYYKFKEIIDNGGFIQASWCSNTECEQKIKDETGADIRVIPFNQDSLSPCIYCKKEGKFTVYFARSY
ncbi:MAG: proline--tRNA ligase [Thaumarchaeota archaeon]|nr:proline--tRNA ligase [Nitrososphaerota archaeon]